MTTAQQIGEAFEEVVEHLTEFEYPYCPNMPLGTVPSDEELAVMDPEPVAQPDVYLSD